MDPARLIRAALPVSIVCATTVLLAAAPRAATFLEFADPHPVYGNQFGATVVALNTGNVVITSPFDDVGGSDAGAVYLFNGATGALISTLRGSTANDQVGGGGVTALPNGNYVIRSPNWDNAALLNVGAATWVSGTSGLTGVVSAANSLIGSAINDSVGGAGVTVLTNGNYVVVTVNWDNGAVANAGAVTWGNSTTGVAGTISAINSLIGSTTGDQAGSAGVTALTNGNYLVRSLNWDNGGVVNAGAVTWGNGTTGVTGTISAANSLVGATTGDQVGNVGLTALTNGNYVVASSAWDNGAIGNAGAATWGNGTTGVSGLISGANSLVGPTANDNVGSGVTALVNGNYVVRSWLWNNGSVADAGAATWGSGTSGVNGVVSAANSLVGSTASDRVAFIVTALANGNYVVTSDQWDNGAVVNAGAATWGNGTTGVTGAVSASNSLVGSTASDQVGEGIVALPVNGNYLIRASGWDNGAVVNTGAVTWGNGTTGVSGVVSAANSLVGSTAGDFLGGSTPTALANGNYVVRQPSWDNDAVVDAGAVTWVNGTTGLTGVISTANSLVGSTAGDRVGGLVTALSNGNYVVVTPLWDNGVDVNAGAVTWVNGTGEASGVVSSANSLVGSSANDSVGFQGVTALPNGNYVIRSSSWDNGAAVNAGAATWGSGTTGVTGVISAVNSLLGSMAGDSVGFNVTALENGDYVVRSSGWDNGVIANAGAATWGSGTAGVSGVVSGANSLVGTLVNTNLQPIVEDLVNGTFLAAFPAEGNGRVRVGPGALPPVIGSAVDVPADQGGWVRLTVDRCGLDVAAGSPPVATYGVWRHVPGTLSARAIPLDPSTTGQLLAALPPGLDVREVEGRFYVVEHGRRSSMAGAEFPPGTWEFVLSVPAVQQAQYVIAATTTSNSIPNDFVVTAHTTTPSIWFISNSVSAQSLDNLAPAAPSPFTAAYTGGATHLHWGENSEPDIGVYNLYRGAAAGFTPTLANRISSSADTGSVDAGTAGSFYKLSAVDVNGNESAFALITPAATVGVGEGLPVAFALDGVWPNPARGSGLQVAFALPTGADARFELMDVSGRRVLVREVGSMGPGHHTVNLGARRKVAPGLYWLRLTQATNQRTTRVTVIE
jgi:hypothetical protein